VQFQGRRISVVVDADDKSRSSSLASFHS
jgi:hypothetical protein